MTNRRYLERLMKVPQDLRNSPAAQALAQKLITELDLLRLKAIARLHARGLPPEVGWSDLLQEAFARVLAGGPEAEAGDPMPDPERSLIALQQLGEIERLFADDPRALQIIEGLFEGWSPEQIRARFEMSKTDYDSTRKRMRGHSCAKA